MTFNEYVEKAMRTNGCGKTLDYFNVAFMGEVGELCDELKKVGYHGHELNEEKIIKEIGDILWSIAYFQNMYELPEFEEKVIKASAEKDFTSHEGEYTPKLITMDKENPSVKDEINFECKKAISTLLALSTVITGETSINVMRGSIEDQEFYLKTVIYVLKDILTELRYILHKLCGGKSLEYAMAMNIEKLEKRYHGSFSTEKSVNREDTK